jgi:hypothetical protein
MSTFTHEQLLSQAQFSSQDVACIMQCRGEPNRLGFSYQLAFVRLLNRFPAQESLEIIEEILVYASVQSNIAAESIESYGNRRKTVSEHQESIRHYLGLCPFSTATDEVEAFLFKEACQLDQTASLSARLKEFLQGTSYPGTITGNHTSGRKDAAGGGTDSHLRQNTRVAL